MTEPTETTGYFRARILKDGRITVDAHIREIYGLKEGDLCRFLLCSVISRKQDVEAPTE